MTIRTRDLLATTVVAVAVILFASGFYLIRFASIQLEDARGEAELIASQLVGAAELARAKRPGASLGAAVAPDPAIGVLLDTVAATSRHVVLVVLQDGTGAVIAPKGDGAGRIDLEAIDPFGDLEDRSMFARLATLLRAGRLYRVIIPIGTDGAESAGRVNVIVDTALLRRRLQNLVLGSTTATALGLLVAWVVALVATSITRRPIQRLGLYIDRLRHGDFDFDADVSRNPDFAALAAQLRLLGQEMESKRLLALAEKQTLAQILDQIRAGILLTDDEDDIVFYNRAFAAVTGRPLEAAQGHRLDQTLGPAHPLVQLTRRVRLEGQGIDNVRTTLPTEDRFQDALVSISTLTGDDERHGLVILLDDLVVLRTLQSLVEYGARATEFGRLTTGVAHEIRNPLHALTLQLELLRTLLDPTMSVADPARVQRSFESCAKAVDDLNHIVTALLDYLRPEPLAVEVVDPNHLVQDVADLFAPDAAERATSIVLQLDETGATITADPTAMRQVLINLVRNALDAMPDGGTITLGTNASEDGVALWVHDTGGGISASDLDRVFLLFHTTKRGGTGVGLSMVHRLVSLHDGRVDIESAPGEGTTVLVRLPRTVRASASDGVASSPEVA